MATSPLKRDLLRPPRQLAPPIPDEHDDFVADLIRPADMVEKPLAQLVGIPFDTTTLGRRGSQFGPRAIRDALATCLCYDAGLGIDLTKASRVADHGDIDVLQTDLDETWERVSEVVGELAGDAAPLVVLGGDHGLTYPVLRGLERTIPGPIGVVSVDAHLDVRVSQHSEVSAGVPFRYILERLEGFVRGPNLVEIGIGGWRNTRRYADFLGDQGARVISAREVRRGDFDALIAEALDRASDGTRGVWLSVDIDGVDGSQAPGTGTPATGGISSFDLLELAWATGRLDNAVGIDVMEVAPSYDQGVATAQLAAVCILTYLAGVFDRSSQ